MTTPGRSPVTMARNVLDALEGELQRQGLDGHGVPLLLAAIRQAHGDRGYGPATLDLDQEAVELVGRLLGDIERRGWKVKQASIERVRQQINGVLRHE